MRLQIHAHRAAHKDRLVRRRIPGLVLARLRREAREEARMAEEAAFDLAEAIHWRCKKEIDQANWDRWRAEAQTREIKRTLRGRGK